MITCPNCQTDNITNHGIDDNIYLETYTCNNNHVFYLPVEAEVPSAEELGYVDINDLILQQYEND